MRLINTILALSALLAFTACEIPEADKKVYPELTDIDNTMWYSYDQKNKIFYDIWYDGQGRGRMLGYDTSERENEIVNRPFSYKFTPATEQFDALVFVDFDDGLYYGGILIPKGNLQISQKDVYIIQLYQTDDKYEVVYDENNNIKSTIQMWKE